MISHVVVDTEVIILTVLQEQEKLLTVFCITLYDVKLTLSDCDQVSVSEVSVTSVAGFKTTFVAEETLWTIPAQNDIMITAIIAIGTLFLIEVTPERKDIIVMAYIKINSY